MCSTERTLITSTGFYSNLIHNFNLVFRRILIPYFFLKGIVKIQEISKKNPDISAMKLNNLQTFVYNINQVISVWKGISFIVIHKTDLCLWMR